MAVYDHCQGCGSRRFPLYRRCTHDRDTHLRRHDGAVGNRQPFSTIDCGSKRRRATFNLTNTTQLAADYTPQKATANGNAPAAVDRLEISKGGIVTAIYADGSRVDAYKIPLANVASPDNLTAISGNVFATSKVRATFS